MIHKIMIVAYQLAHLVHVVCNLKFHNLILLCEASIIVFCTI